MDEAHGQRLRGSSGVVPTAVRSPEGLEGWDTPRGQSQPEGASEVLTGQAKPGPFQHYTETDQITTDRETGNSGGTTSSNTHTGVSYITNRQKFPPSAIGG